MTADGRTIKKDEDSGRQVIVMPRNTAVVAPDKMTVLTTKQLNALNARTPKHYKRKRPAKGGGEWDFVPVGYVKKRLNQIFGHENWSFTIVSSLADSFDIATRTGSCTVHGRLTVYVDPDKQPVIKEQFGRAQVKFLKGTKEPMDFGNDMKSAGSDALKKCASELGIASDVYYKQEFIDVEIEDNELVDTKEVVRTTEQSKMAKKADKLLDSIKETTTNDDKKQQSPSDDKHQGTTDQADDQGRNDTDRQGRQRAGQATRPRAEGS